MKEATALKRGQRIRDRHGVDSPVGGNVAADQDARRV
jgi:hypothetical protein